MILEFLLTLGIIHRDVKFDNFLLDEQLNLKLIDFGSAKLQPRKENQEIINRINQQVESFLRNVEPGSELRSLDDKDTETGSSLYLPPEFIEKAETSRMWDLWSFGIMVYRMATRRFPFYANPYLLPDIICHKEPDFLNEDGSPLDPNLLNLLQLLLIKNPKKRIGYNDIKEIRKHSYFSEISEMNTYFVSQSRRSISKLEINDRMSFNRRWTPYSKSHPLQEDYAKQFTWFFFYRIFKIRLNKDGVLELCFPKEKRLYQSFVVTEIFELVF